MNTIKKVSLSHLSFGDERYIGLKFYPDKVIQALVKGLPDIKWSKQYNMAYLPNNAHNLNRGYISIRATFLYNQNGLIGYKIKPQMPDEPELIDKYKKWYSDLFKFQDSTTIQPIYSNYQNWIRPLNDYDGKLNINNQSDSFKVYFSIESGAIYGYGNGWGGLRQNRMLFEKLLPELSTEQIILLMYSKNCITRLHAFHYYLTHKSDFTDTQKIDIWMEQILTNHPRIQCSDTDVIYTCDAKEQLLIYVNHDLSEK